MLIQVLNINTNHCCIIHCHFFSCWNVNCFWTHFFIHKFVHKADIGKCASYHNFMISATTSIRIEVFVIYAMLNQVFCSRAILVDSPWRRNLICGNTISKLEQAITILYPMKTRWFHRHVLKIRRLVNVGGVWIPWIESWSRNWKPIPHRIALCDSLINALEHVRQYISLKSLYARNKKYTSQSLINRWYLK